MTGKVKTNIGRNRNSGHLASDRRDLKLGIFLLVFLIFGIVLRILSANTIVFTNLVYSPRVKTDYPGTRTPEDTVKSFYMSIDNGDYEEAYEMALEPNWTGAGIDVSFREAVVADPSIFHGWTQRERFVERSRGELGVRGDGINLNSIETSLQENFDIERIREIYDLPSVTAAFKVAASGNMIGACTIFKWMKEVTVVQVGKRYKVLLDGTKRENSLYYQSWFSGIEVVGHLRGTLQ